MVTILTCYLSQDFISGMTAADLVTVWLDNTENVNDETENYMKNVELTPVTLNAQADPRNPISSL